MTDTPLPNEDDVLRSKLATPPAPHKPVKGKEPKPPIVRQSGKRAG
jgi:hypothetical protein